MYIWLPNSDCDKANGCRNQFPFLPRGGKYGRILKHAVAATVAAVIPHAKFATSKRQSRSKSTHPAAVAETHASLRPLTTWFPPTARWSHTHRATISHHRRRSCRRPEPRDAHRTFAPRAWVNAWSAVPAGAGRRSSKCPPSRVPANAAAAAAPAIVRTCCGKTRPSAHLDRGARPPANMCARLRAPTTATSIHEKRDLASQ